LHHFYIFLFNSVGCGAEAIGQLLFPRRLNATKQQSPPPPPPMFDLDSIQFSLLLVIIINYGTVAENYNKEEGEKKKE